jgi:uncharacterized membrane protein YdbT with pleckstrin-like domain
MSFLIEGEKIIKRFGQSRFVNIKFYIAGIVLLIFPVIYYLYFTKVKLPIPEIYVVAIPPIIGCILILMAEIKKMLGSYYITNYRVVSIKGSFKKTMDSCTYDKIVNVKVMQTFLQRLLNMGTIDITTFQRTEILLESIANPNEIEKLIYKQMEAQKEEALKKGEAQFSPQQTQQPILPSQETRKTQISNTPIYPQQNRPLLASERKYQEMPASWQEQQKQEKKKRFKIF